MRRSNPLVSLHTEMKDPTPKSGPLTPTPYVWPSKRRIHVTELQPTSISFNEVLESRRSGRCLRHAPLKMVMSWLAYSTRARFISENCGLERTMRPAMSAGALHPISVVLFPSLGVPRLIRSIGDYETAEILHIADKLPLETLREQTASLLPNSVHADIVILIADGMLFDSQYEHANSLLWRSAGALLQTLGLAATAFGLQFCALGLLGKEALEALELADRHIATGVAVVGL